MKSMGMINSHVGMILLYTAMGIPISLFITYAFVSNIPKELDEAAIMDGCNGIKLFLRIIVPLLTSVLVTEFALNFLSVWNEFTAPLYMLNTVEMWPMTWLYITSLDNSVPSGICQCRYRAYVIACVDCVPHRAKVYCRRTNFRGG